MRIWMMTALLVGVSMQAAAAGKPESFTVNGLKVVFLPNTATEVVVANMYIRGGVAVAGISRAGIERLALQVATRATKNYPKDRLSADLERMNTILSSTAGPDYSSINMQCVKQNLGESWKIFTDVLLNPLFDSTDVEREKERTLGAIRQVQDNPDQYLNELAIQALYTENPYSVDPAGTEGTVKAFTAGNLQTYLQGRMTTGQMLLVVVGNTTREEMEPMVKASFGALPQGSFKILPPPAVRHSAPSVKVVERALPTNYITGLFAAPAFGSAESYPMMVGRSILRERLFLEVRTKRGLSYAPAAVSGSMFSNYGGIYVTAVKPETTVTVMIDEIRKLQTEPVPAKTLDDTKNGYLTNYYLSVETDASQADVLARYELSGAGYEESTRLVDNVRKVTPAEVQKVWNDYAHNLQFVILGSPVALRLAPFLY